MASIVGSLVVLVALWLGLALGCGFGAKSILQGKGRSGTAGFWLGFCLGLTGLLIAALLSSTPEHEARKMQMQMQMMGIAPPPGAGYATSVTAPAELLSPSAAKSTSNAPSVVMSIVVCIGYALGWIGLSNYGFRHLFGDSETLALLIFVVGLTLATSALIKKSRLLTGLAVGVALGVCGLGLAALGGVVGDWPTDNKQLIALPLDIVAFVSAALVLGRSSSKPPAALSWWKPAAIALGGAGVLLTLAVSTPFGPGAILGNAGMWGGFVIASLCLIKGGRTALSLAIGWAGTSVVYLVGTEFRGLSWTASTTLQQLVMLVAGGLAGVAIIGLQHTERDTAGIVGGSLVSPQLLNAAATFTPPPPVRLAAPPDRALLPMPIATPLTPLLAVPHSEVTMPRSRLPQVAPVQLRFATGETVVLSGALVLGRAPIVSGRFPSAQTMVVADATFTISSTHCLLSIEDGAVWVEDLGSTNGTDVISPSGITELGLGQRVVLTSADRLQLGDNWCLIEP